MDRLYIIRPFLIFLMALPLKGADHTLRTVWSLRDPWTSLYRVEGNRWRSDLLIRSRDSLKEAEPRRFLLESPFCVLGNIKPEGLFRFFEMASLLSREELQERPGYAVDGSADNLKSGGGALFWRNTGVFGETTRSEFWNAGFWAGSRRFSGISLDVAGDCTVPRGGETEETGWFREEPPRPEGRLYHAGGDLRWDGPRWTARLRTAFSGGETFLPGTSLLPEITLYVADLTATARYWRNSESYRDRFLEFPGWNWQGEGEIRYRSGSHLWEGTLELGKPRPDRETPPGLCREYNLGWRREASLLRCRFSGSFVFDPREKLSREIRPKGSVSVRISSWTLGGGADLVLPGRPYRMESGGGSLKLKFSPSRIFWAAGEGVYRTTPERTVWTPWLETGFRWRNWVFKAAGGYPLVVQGAGEEEPLSVRVTVEWSGIFPH